MIDINWNPDRRTLRQFAAGWFPAFFLLVGGLLAYRLHSWQAGLWVWMPALAVSVACWCSPWLARRVFVGWILACYPLGWTMSHLLLAVIYFLVLTPIGLALRAAGQDRLGRAFDRSARTYWTPHETPVDKSRYFRQF